MTADPSRNPCGTGVSPVESECGTGVSPVEPECGTGAPPMGAPAPGIGSSIRVADVRAAARRPEVVEAMERFYAEATERIAARGPVCWNKGECCQFGRYGHRLYVTALEAAYYLASGETAAPVREDACPHAFDGRCHARARRPLGCRIFYCDPGARHWQGPLTESLLNRLRKMHDELHVPYFYAEWMTVLKTIEGEAEETSVVSRQ